MELNSRLNAAFAAMELRNTRRIFPNIRKAFADRQAWMYCTADVFGAVVLFWCSYTYDEHDDHDRIFVADRYSQPPEENLSSVDFLCK